MEKWAGWLAAVAWLLWVWPSLRPWKWRRRVAVKIDQLWTLGRLKDNDVVVDDDYVSPRHCQVARDVHGEFWVRDLGSTNGTWLDKQRGRQDQIRVHDWQPWTAGYTLRIGHSAIPRIR